MNQSCAVPESDFEGTFDEIKQAMSTDKYWMNFFVRPCCPPPSVEQATHMLNKRREEIQGRSDFSADERAQLLGIVDEREMWYVKSPFYRSNAQ